MLMVTFFIRTFEFISLYQCLEATSVQDQKMWRSNFGKMLMNTGLNGDREEVGDPMKLEGEELESSPKHKDTKSRSPIGESNFWLVC